MIDAYADLPILVAFASWLALLFWLARRAERRASFVCDAIPWPHVLACVPLVAFATLGGHRPATLARVAACIALNVAAASDARTGYLFDAVTFPAAVLTATLAVIDDGAGAAAAGVVLLTAIFGGVVAASRGRAMGFGDVKAMYAIGAAFGPFGAVVALFAASVSGIVASWWIVAPTRRVRHMPFGTHLAFGCSFALIASDVLFARLAGR